MKFPLYFRFDATVPTDVVGQNEIRMDDMLKATQNGLNVINSVLTLDHECSEIISCYFHPKHNDPLCSKLKNWIINTSWCSLENKRAILFNIIKESEILTKDECALLEKNLARMIRYRNAFAHGAINQKDGKLFISYYRSGQQDEELADVFWKNLYSNFLVCQDLIDRIKVAIVLNSKTQ